MSVTTRLTLDEIVTYIDVNFTAVEARALHMYFMQDRNLDEIARTLDLPDTKSAERLVRRLVARLRYRFIEAECKAADADQPEV